MIAIEISAGVAEKGNVFPIRQPRAPIRRQLILRWNVLSEPSQGHIRGGVRGPRGDNPITDDTGKID
jgi:hypothetical protein